MPTSLGYGIGLRPQHFPDFQNSSKLSLDWLEIVSENYMGIGGRSRQILEKLRADYPIAAHGVGLSIAGSDPLDQRYLRLLKQMSEWLEPVLITDHLCWTSWKGLHSYDLLPFPLNEESLIHIARRVDRVQEYLGRSILLENPSSYVAFADSEMSEADFLAELCARTGCGILLDLNNCVVNSRNLGWDPVEYLERLHPGMVHQFHLAGHSYEEDISIDTHDHAVPAAVWKLFEQASQRFPGASALVEWDDQIPSLDRMLEEVATARSFGGNIEGRSVPAFKSELTSTPAQSSGTSSTLSQTQEAFFSAILSYRRPDELLPQLRTSPAGVLRGIGVYQHAYPQRIVEVLKNTFPTLHFILEDELFAATAAHYVEQVGTSDFSINYVGEKWPEFLATVASPYKFGVPQEAVAALAAFDWSYYELLIREQRSAEEAALRIGAADLAAWSPETWEKQSFRLSREASLLSLDWQIFAVWRDIQNGLTPPPPPEAPELCLFKRSDGHLLVEKLDEENKAFWRLMNTGTCLEQLIEHHPSGEDVPEAAVAEILSILLKLAQEDLLERAD